MAGINWTKQGGWTVENEKTDYKTDFKTDHRTDNVHHHSRRKCSGPWWRRRCWTSRWTTPDTTLNNSNALKNQVNTEKNQNNTTLNTKNTKRNDSYATTISTATNTRGGDYTTQRQFIRNIQLSEGSASEDSVFRNRLEDLYKDYYREDYLQSWDVNLGRTPLYGDFDPNYYARDTEPGRTANSNWTEAINDDDIDITERYGNKQTYYLQHYTNVAPSGTRGNRAEVTEQANQYIEETPTDAEVSDVRRLQLGTNINTQTERLLNIPEVAEEWNKAKRDDPYWRGLAREKFLSIEDPDEFAALFRLSERDQDKQIKLNYNVNLGYGITELEDAINEAAGDKAQVDVRKFGALTQSVLKDTLEEMKRAKGKEETLATMRGFSGFSEIMDINSTLTNSILGDSGVGGVLAFTSGGKAEESLESGLSKISGIGNNVTHNWQKWFDEELKTKYDEAIELGYDPDDASKTIQIEADFANNFLNEYLIPRFDQSKSMDEFTEYLSVRQEEQNPFQTMDSVQAIKLVADMRANKYLEDIQQVSDRRFDANFYFDPSGNIARGENWNEDSRQASYAIQKETVNQDWENAQAGINSGDINWAQQAYRFGIDLNNKEQFAHMHFQIKGQGQGYDAAEDILNAGKVKDHIYNNILPALEDEALLNPTVFGQFITPEEFADDMLEGLDPTDNSQWDEILQRYGLKGFKGDFDELKEHIMSALRTGSAQEIREQIKYLNEKRKKPTQKVLGVTYIEREEDYKDEQSKAETELYSVFQKSGFQGTEDEFYENFFPDLNRSDMKVLTKAGRDTGLEGFGLDLTDPFASLGTIESFFDDDKEMTDEEKDFEKNRRSSYFNIEDDDDDEWEYKPPKREDEVLDEFTTMFKDL